MRFPNLSDHRTFTLGTKHVSRADPKIRHIVKEHGPIEFDAGGAPFESLVEAIISQQLNGQSARSIFNRLKALLGTGTIDAQALIKSSVPRLRKAGVSPQKISYLKDLSSQVVRGHLDLEELRTKPDEEVMRILDAVRGIGPWTAHMFLLFTLGRPDVLPVGDLGIQMAVRRVYSLRKLPGAKKIEQIATNWHPYCSVASLYLWQTKDGQ